MSSTNYVLYLNASVTPGTVRQWLIDKQGFDSSGDRQTLDGFSILANRGCLVLVRQPDPDISGPYNYRQDYTIFINLDPNKQDNGQEFLLCLIGDILQFYSGDAVLEYDTGGTPVLRRGETVWIQPDAFTREHLFAGSFKPARLVIGLPPPDKDEAEGAE